MDDSECLPKDRCGAGEYLNPSYILTDTTINYACNKCGNGVSFQTKASHLDTSCVPCGTCDAGFFIETKCTKAANITCAACVSCASGQYQQGVCSPVSQVAPVCEPCFDGCTMCDNAATCKACNGGKLLSFDKKGCGNSCGDGEFVVEGSQVCAKCAFSCLRCSGTQPEQCTACRNEATGSILPEATHSYLLPTPDGNECVSECTPGHFKNRDIGECSLRQVCVLSKQWQVPFDPDNASAAFLDSDCRAISDCLPGEYVIVGYTKTSDRVCEACQRGTIDHDSDFRTPCEVRESQILAAATLVQHPIRSCLITHTSPVSAIPAATACTDPIRRLCSHRGPRPCRCAIPDGMSRGVRLAPVAKASTLAQRAQPITTSRQRRRACPVLQASRCRVAALGRARVARPAAQTTTAGHPPPARCAVRATASAGRA